MPGVSLNDCEGIEHEGTSSIVRHPIDKNLICYPDRFVDDSRFAAFLVANYILLDPREAVTLGPPLPMSFQSAKNAEYEAAWEVNVHSQESQKIVASVAVLADSGRVVPFCDNRDQNNLCNIAVPACDDKSEESPCDVAIEAESK